MYDYEPECFVFTAERCLAVLRGDNADISHVSCLT